MDTLVRIEEVTKRYDDDGRPALDRVSLEIEPGEAVAIMGPSGSGKSTLLNLIAGLDRPTSGAVTVAGTRIDQLGETGAALFRRSRVGMIFQFFNLLDDLTVVDNVLLPAQLGGMRAAEGRARADELLEMLRIERHRNAYPARLSGGERQRVAIARALVNRPALLLADEPTGALDSATGEEIGALLAGLHRSGLTLVLVTHNPDLAARYAEPDDRARRRTRRRRRRRATCTRSRNDRRRDHPCRPRRDHPATAADDGHRARRAVSTASTVLALALVVDSNAPFDHAFATQRGADIVATIDPTRERVQPRANGAPPGSERGRRPVRRGNGDGTKRRDDAAAADPRRTRDARRARRRPRASRTDGGRRSPARSCSQPEATSGTSGSRSARLDDRRHRVAPADADRRRPRELGHRLGLGVGRPGRDPALRAARRNERDPDALPLRRRRDRHARCTPTSPGSPRPCRAERSPERCRTTPRRSSENGNIAPFVPFLLAFGILGIVMSVLIVANVVGGAVVSGYRRIGILKSIGFTPAQVALAYAAQVALPALVGCLDRRRGRQPARGAATSAERQRLRRRPARRADLGRRRRPGRDLRPCGARRAPAGAARRAAQHGSGDRDRTRTAERTRLRRPSAARPRAAAPRRSRSDSQPRSHAHHARS